VPRGATFVSPIHHQDNFSQNASVVANADRAKLALEFVTKHFVVVSAIAVLAATALGMDFLYAYLVRFDWSLFGW